MGQVVFRANRYFSERSEQLFLRAERAGRSQSGAMHVDKVRHAAGYTLFLIQSDYALGRSFVCGSLYHDCTLARPLNPHIDSGLPV